MKQAPSVKDVMNPDVMTVTDDMTTDELARYLTDREISGAPVVDSGGRLVGVVSLTDIGRHLAEPPDFESPRSSQFYRESTDDVSLEALGQSYVEERTATVRDVMTPVVHQVPANVTIREAARIMVEHHIHRLLVTQNREPVGIITSMDLLRAMAGQS